MFCALEAYCKVDRFSSRNFYTGDRFAIIRQYELPPSEFLKMVVSLDSL